MTSPSLLAVFALLAGAVAGLLLWLALRRTRRELVDAKAAAGHTQQQLKTALDALESGIALYDRDDRLVLCNRAYVALIGGDSAQFRPGSTFRELVEGWTVQEGLAPADAAAFIEGQLQRHRVDGSRVEMEMKHGQWVRVVKRLLPDGGVVALLTDLSAERAHASALDAAQRAADASRRALEQAIEALPDGFALYGADDRLVVANRAYVELTGADFGVAVPGVKYGDLVEHWADHRGLDGAVRKAFVVAQHERHRTQGSRADVPMRRGRWVRVTKQVTADDGVVTLLTDLTDERAHARELRDARDAARAANQAKSTFLATMSHEIRTPMNGVLGMLDVLEHEQPSAAQQRTIATMRESAHALLRIIDDVLDFSKIEAGRLELEAVEFGLRALVDGSVGALRPQADAKGLALQVDVEAGSAEVLVGDPMRVRQIVTNLVGNAVKFTPAGHVAVGAATRPLGEGAVELHLRVEDTGIGLSETERQRLFAPFAQADSSTTRRYGGTGLGLSIVRRLAQAMGGDVSVASEPGRGACFDVRLRLQQAPAARPRDTGPLERRRQPRVAPAGDAARPRVLVVDDHPANREVLARQLALLGLDSECVANGREALLRLEALPPLDAVLTDIHMPELDGYALARAWRARESARGAPRLPMVAVTANALRGEADACVAAGLDGYLAKPVQLTQLRSTMARWLPVTSAPLPRAEVTRRPDVPTPLFDRTRLVDFFGDDRATIERLLAECLDTARDCCAAAGRALDGADASALAGAAHRLHGAARTSGLLALGAAAAALEAAGRASDLAAGAGALAQLRRVLDDTRDAVRQSVENI